MGYHIVHCDSGRRLAAGAGNDARNGATPLIISDHFGSAFVFEQVDNGAVRYVFFMDIRRKTGLSDAVLCVAGSGLPTSRATLSGLTAAGVTTMSNCSWGRTMRVPRTFGKRRRFSRYSIVCVNAVK